MTSADSYAALPADTCTGDYGCPPLAEDYIPYDTAAYCPKRRADFERYAFKVDSVKALGRRAYNRRVFRYRVAEGEIVIPVSQEMLNDRDIVRRYS